VLVLREAQVRVLQKVRIKTFEERLEDHCRRFFPRASNALGEQLPSAIRDAVKRANFYGFDSQRDVCKYLNLVFTFGRDFDKSTLLPWLKPILNSSIPGPPKMAELYAAGLQHEAEGRGYFARVSEPR
jgi:hypothetical protein